MSCLFADFNIWEFSFQQNGLLLNVETGSHELVILSYATVCLHPSVSLNNEKILS